MGRKIISSAVVWAILFCHLPCVVAADDVVTAIEQAVRQYNGGDYAGAASNLVYATQLIRQKRSEKMGELLPPPLAGWQTEATSTQTVGVAVLGGGVTVCRDYKKGPAVVSIEIVADSPMLQSLMLMLNNPMFAGASGGNLETIKEQRAIVKYEEADKKGEINIVVATKFVVIIHGREVTREELVAYAQALDFKTMAAN